MIGISASDGSCSASLRSLSSSSTSRAHGEMANRRSRVHSVLAPSQRTSCPLPSLGR